MKVIISIKRLCVLYFVTILFEWDVYLIMDKTARLNVSYVFDLMFDCHIDFNL